MATDSAKNADVPKEQSIPDNKTTPEAAEHSSTEVNKNKTDMTNNVKKDDKTGDVKKNRRKVGMSITTSSPTPRRKNPSPRTLISGVPTTMKLPSKAHEYMAKVEDDDLAYLEHYYDHAKLSEHDLLELGAREMFP
ncbi:hypothetical protein FPRO06_07193 [Fusarium proliferatum]|nr:hypothetical protein FPRO03_05050 [Fusarium proliferatum]KAG4285933.1 hypothetical protein FPRO06_07193 [Fusarium proliferatum]